MGECTLRVCVCVFNISCFIHMTHILYSLVTSWPTSDWWFDWFMTDLLMFQGCHGTMEGCHRITEDVKEPLNHWGRHKTTEDVAEPLRMLQNHWGCHRTTEVVTQQLRVSVCFVRITEDVKLTLRMSENHWGCDQATGGIKEQPEGMSQNN